MTLLQTLRTRRTVRLFQQKRIPYRHLEECVEAARLAPSARNIQPLEYVVVDSEKLRGKMFSCLGMGGGITDFSGREPAAYVAVLVNRELRGEWAGHDCGMAAENLVLAAWNRGIGSCILARINRDKIREILGIPDRYETDLVVALGYPAEKPVPEDMTESTNSYRDGKGVLHVPKRPLKQILHRNGF
jgi:nitroreductase